MGRIEAILFLFMFFVLVGDSRADSLATSGLEINYSFSYSQREEEFLQEPIPNKAFCRWGPVPAYPQISKSSPPNSGEKKKSKYPTIGVRYKVYLGKSNHKYIKKLSSRGKYTITYINITPIIIEEAKKNKIPPLLLKAVIEVESGFNNYAVGPSGALGLCQLMPSTARRLGVKDPFHPRDNISGGAKLLGILYRKYGGNIDKTLAAYNLGSYTTIPYHTRVFIREVKRRMHW